LAGAGLAVEDVVGAAEVDVAGGVVPAARTGVAIRARAAVRKTGTRDGRFKNDSLLPTLCCIKCNKHQI
jgi:hypothetical protein